MPDDPEVARLKAEIERLRAAIQQHHDTKHGAPKSAGRSAAVLATPDLALYAAAGIVHRVLPPTAGGRLSDEAVQ